MKFYPSSKVQIVAPYYLERPIRVKSAESGMSLVDFLCHRLPYRSYQFWQERVLLGMIRKNGIVLDLQFQTHAGEQLTHCIHNLKEPSVPSKIETVYEDNEVLVVNKPAPLPVHPGGRYNQNSLTQILAKKLGRSLFVIHRIDAVTTGLVVFAKNQESAKKWTKAFHQGHIQKEYYALVRLKEHSKKPSDEWSCSLPIGRLKSFVFCADERAHKPKKAFTRFRLIKQLDEQIALIRCFPETGRTHQIRLHAEALGHPILGDQIYDGTDLPPKEGRFQNQAIALHNSTIEFEGIQKRFSLEIPSSWTNTEIRKCLFQQ